MILSLILLFSLPVLSAAVDGPCQPTVLMPRPQNPGQYETYRAHAGDWEIIFTDTQKPEQKVFPQDLLITNHRSGQSCPYESSVTTSVFWSSNPERLFVLGYSGSRRFVDIVDPTACRRIEQIGGLSEGITLQGDQIRVQAGCECNSAEQDSCTCDPARLYRLDGQCRPILDPEGSLVLTRETMGIAFDKTRRVAYPKSPKTRLLP